MGGPRINPEAIQACAQSHPHWSHKQIAAHLTSEGTACSVSSVYNVLKYGYGLDKGSSGEATPTAVPSQDAASALAALISSMANVDPAKVAEIATAAAVDYVASLNLVSPEPEVIVRSPSAVITFEQRPHAAFRECLKRFEALGKLWLVGPAGTGKTTLASQLAKATESRTFGFISCTAGMSETWVLGRPTLDGGFISTPFIDCYENGGTFLFDEADAMDANTTLCINSALSNGMCYLPSRTGNHIAYRHESFRIIFATNTLGTGADTLYTGREAMDAATIDRFTLATVYVDYDVKLERSILPDGTLAETLWGLRRGVRQHNIRRIVSTRAFADGRAMLANGYTEGDIVDALTMRWTPEEKKKAMSV